MTRNNQETMEGLQAEFDQFNAATSASVGLTPMQSETDIMQEDLAGDMANANELPEGEHEPHSLP